MARGVQLQRRCQAAEVEDQWLHLLCVHPVQDRVTLSLQHRHRGQYPLSELQQPRLFSITTVEVDKLIAADR